MFTPFQKINKERFMNILAEIWDKWATKDVIINAAERVGISQTGLDVYKMQNIKLKLVSKLMKILFNMNCAIKPSYFRKHIHSYVKWRVTRVAISNITFPGSRGTQVHVLTAAPQSGTDSWVHSGEG